MVRGDARRSLVLVALLIAALALFAPACSPSGNRADASAPSLDDGGAVFSSCTTLCYRPGDCAVAYPDDDVCPAGFLCSSRFRCVTDGGRD